MDDFGFVVFMDVQKSGSTFISHVLREVLDPASFVRQSSHRRIKKRRPGTIYFSSVREPIASWLSLFRYGCDRNGTLAARLRQRGRGELYEETESGFARWLDFVLDEANAGELGEGYDKVRADLIGLQTFRFLALSFSSPVALLRSAQTESDFDTLYDAEAITSFVVRNEYMADDLLRFFQEHLTDHVDLKKAAAVLADAPRVNASRSPAPTAELNPALLRKVRRKEAFILRRFYPDVAA